MADSGAATHWSFDDSGLEETVVLDLASPRPDRRYLSGVGDIGGFKHDALDVSPGSGAMFSIRSSATRPASDFAEGAPLIVARGGGRALVVSGGPNGAYSTDGGVSWTPFAQCASGQHRFGLDPAVSADGTTFV